jgi:hypothetical protein
MDILRKKLMQISRNVIYYDECFTIKVLDTKSSAIGTLNFNNNFKQTGTSIKYSKNNEATINTYNNIGITVNAGDKIKIYAKLKGKMPTWPSVDESNISSFIKANFYYEVYGNINSLVYGTDWYNEDMYTCGEQQFANLFAKDTNIKIAKNLVFPYSEYNSCACYHMFNNCSNLEYGPEYIGYAYPKFDINNIDKGDSINGVYSANMGIGYGTMYGMFENCSNMKKGPECLYLNIHRYDNPTNGGSYYPNYPSTSYNPNYTNGGLNTDLPKFFGGHLSRMFNNCTSLTEAPKILLLDAYPSSCAGMFGNNTNLELIELYIGDMTPVAYGQISAQGDTCLGLFILDNVNGQLGSGKGGITYSDNANKAPKNLNIHYYISSKIPSSERIYIIGSARDSRAWPTTNKPTDGFSTVETTEITETELPDWIPYSIK